MPYIHFTEEQKERAKNTDLVELLRRDGEKLKRSGSEWEWRDRDGAKVTIRGNQWFHQYDRQGGMAIDFVRRYYNLSYPEAIRKLLGISGAVIEEVPLKRPQDRKPFVLPEAHSNMRRVYAYLMQKRFIDGDVITHFAKAHALYEDAKHHNAIFVGFDEKGDPRHAHKKSTYSFDDSFRGNVDGCRPEYSFHHIGTSERLYVFEAPIDMLAYISLHKENWQRHSYVALCCVAEHAMMHQLTEHPALREVVICTDHDKPGIEAFYKLKEILNDCGYFDVRPEFSQYKDWNEDVKALHGETPVPAEEHPQLTHMRELCDRLSKVYKNEKCPPNARRKLSDGYSRLVRITNNGNHYKRYIDEIRTESFKCAACAYLCAKDMYHQMGMPITDEQLREKMTEMYQPHKDRGMLPGKLGETREDLKSIGNDSGVLTESEFKARIENVLRVGVDFLRIHTFVALEQAVGQQTEACGMQMA